MKKAVVISDSFKGTMSADMVCSTITQQLLCFDPGCTVTAIPIADGGEGTVDCFLSAFGGEKVLFTASGPFFGPIPTHYAILPDNNTAVIEMASAAGLHLAKRTRLVNPEYPSTYGVGEIVIDAIKRGCRKIILGLGGSCTNDGGAGIASALGVRFFDERDCPFVPTGGTLARIHRIDLSGILPELKECEKIAICDVKNPLCGPNGASYVFAPQKGASFDRLEFLDQNLAHFAVAVERATGISITELPGAGAAGGMGGGVFALLGFRLCPGIDTVLDLIDANTILKDADIVFTGEGKIDAQTLQGKVVDGVARRAAKFGVPVIVLAGVVEDTAVFPLYERGVSAIFGIQRTAAVSEEELSHDSVQNLSYTVQNILRFYHVVR